jgi:hypothetical protein
VDLERVAPVVYRHVTHPRSCHQPTRYPALPGRMATLLSHPLHRKGFPPVAMTKSVCRANSPGLAGQAVLCLRAVAGHPIFWVGQWWRSVESEPFVVSGGLPRDRRG